MTAFSGDPTKRVNASVVRSWLKSDDPEVLGAIYDFMTRPNGAARISPPLDFAEYQNLMFRYGDICLRRDEAGEWADSRYSYGTRLVGWILKLWKGDDRERQFVQRWKEWLSQKYRDGDSTVRRCIVDAVLEHLFEHAELRSYFSDWKHDSLLAIAFEEADEWSRFGGHSPLGPKQK